MTITLEPGLYVTATPIGNLGDITYRAVATLRAADLILCEDTRQTAKLCAAYDIDTPRSAYHEHNAARVRPEIIKKLKDGAAICLLSDAGTPLISDPGFKLVRAARDEGLRVTPLPGPAAAIAALSAGGAPSGHFHFAGFAPAKSGARAKYLQSLASIPATLVFYETAPRLAASLNAMADAFGDRRAVVARELTKIHESFYEGALAELAARFSQTPVKGEIVILVFPPAPQPTSEDALEDFLRTALQSMRVKDAASAAAQELGVSRARAYEKALQVKDRP
ncbi:MAG: 16S rRNA (cytidine(1402)-2'-O)-methyltransferase [Hyphococcus sp.]